MKFLGVLSVLASTLIGGALAGTPASVAITGVQNNGIQPRLELRQMKATNPDQFNLYMLALRYFQSTTESDQLSHYQIAGIHGRPFVPWNGDTSGAGQNGYGGGYCTHASNIFLPWHRPYLALYEQQLYNLMQQIVVFFPSSSLARYQAAAKTFRLPYWDWAAPPPSGSKPYPDEIGAQYIAVDTPTGLQLIQNPLWRYDFKHDLSQDFPWPPAASWTSTKRDPSTQDASAQSNDGYVATQIANAAQNLRDRVYALLTNKAYNFMTFSNEATANASPATGDSLESVHDAIHSITGSGGHMTYLEYSAHDPVFFLHHVNIDRLWAIWDYVNPQDAYVQPQRSQQSTYVWGAGTLIDAGTGLLPFHSNTARANWTSTSVKKTNVFGYTYPELVNPSTSSVNAAINALYGSRATAKTKRDDNSTLPAGSKYQYYTNFDSLKFQNNGSYAIYLFLGEPTGDANTWPLAENLVGTHAVSSSVSPGSPSESGSDATNVARPDLLVSGSIPVTNSLQDAASAGQLPDLELETVKPYLQSKLTWRVALLDGTEIPTGNMNLTVKTYANEYSPPATDADLPVWGEPFEIDGVTGGQGACDVVYVEAEE